MTGILPVDKPAGFTSFDVVAKARGMLRTRKIGHAGTLDPQATGVLPLFVGGATRFIDLLPRQDKRYTAVLRLGVITDTQDMTGTVLETRPVTVGEREVQEMLTRFTGEQQQIPPMYSAVQVKGVRLYDLARQGVEVERKPRAVTFSRIALLRADPAEGLYTIDVACSKGAYIRTLCHDIGLALGCGGTMGELRRTEACGFVLDQCRTMAQLQALADEGGLEEALLPVESALGHYPSIRLAAGQAGRFQNGIRLGLDGLQPEGEGPHTVFDEAGTFLGLARPDFGENRLMHIKLLSR